MVEKVQRPIYYLRHSHISSDNGKSRWKDNLVTKVYINTKPQDVL